MPAPQILSNNRIISLKCFDKKHRFLTQKVPDTQTIQNCLRVRHLKKLVFYKCKIRVLFIHDFYGFVKMQVLLAYHLVHNFDDFDAVVVLAVHVSLDAAHESVLVVEAQFVDYY